MMTDILKKENCPSCGTIGRELMEHATKRCGSCGTVYNTFGVVLSFERDDEMQWT